MKIKPLFTTILTLTLLTVAIVGGYIVGRVFSTPEPVSASYLPPLSSLDLPSQTQNGITVTLESYYADAARFVFEVNATSEKGDAFLDRFSLKDEDGREINSGGSFDSRGTNPFHSVIEFNPAVPIKTEHFKGQLTFAAVTSIGDGEVIAQFSFDLDLPIHPALTFNLKQTVWANGIEILLDRLVITPAHTHAYLCYIKPTDADWMIGQDSTVRINGKTMGIQEYGLLFDSDFGDIGKGGDPEWTPPIQNGRCVKVGFAVGDADPKSLTLTIPMLEQSIPEVIPEDELAAAREKLLPQGIDIDWEVVSFAGGGGSGPVYNKIPDGMSELEAYNKFLETLGYFHEGPWVFAVKIQQ